MWRFVACVYLWFYENVKSFFGATLLQMVKTTLHAQYVMLPGIKRNKITLTTEEMSLWKLPIHQTQHNLIQNNC